MKISTKKILVAAIATAVMGVGMVQTASAGAKAFALLDITNLSVTSSAGQLDFQNDAPSEFSSQNSASLNGAAGVVTSDAFPPNVDAALACSGDCGGIGENNFTQLDAINQQFARGDSTTSGNLFLGTGASTTLAEIELLGTAAAPNISSAATNFNGNFQLGDPTQIGETQSEIPAGTILTISFDANRIAEALLHDQAAAGGVVANSNFDVKVELTGPNGILFSWSADGVSNNTAGLASETDPFNIGVVAQANIADKFELFSNSGTFTLVTGELAAGLYNIAFTQDSQASANVLKVPEPATLGLFGLGLLGMASSLRRKVGA